MGDINAIASKVDMRSREMRKVRKWRVALDDALFWARDSRLAEYRRVAHRDRAAAYVQALGGIASNW